MKRRSFIKLTATSALAGSFGGNGLAAVAADTVNHLNYPMADGWVDNWLIAGPQNIPVAGGEYKFQPALRPPIVQQHFTEEPLFAGAPVEGDSFRVGGSSLLWRYFMCDDDHLIDLSAWHPKSDYMRAWACCEVCGPKSREVEAGLFTNGPAVVWINGQRVFSHQEFDYLNVHRAGFRASLKQGDNTLLVRFDHVITRNAPHTLAVRLKQPDEFTIKVPVRTPDTVFRESLEKMFDRAYSSRDTYGAGDEIRMKVPEAVRVAAEVRVELLSGKDMLRSARWNPAQGQPFVSLGAADALREGNYRLRLVAGENVRELPFEIARDAFSVTPYGTFEARRLEALQLAAANAEGLRADIARMELGRWKDVNSESISTAMEGVNDWKDGSDGELMMLLGMLIRYRDKPDFPTALKQRIEDCVARFRYWTEDPGRTAMTYGSENHQITFHTAEILAGQVYAGRTFNVTGKTAAWHRERGEKLAIAWLKKRMAFGFDEWNANGYFAADVGILSHLADLARHPLVREGARQVIDKIFFCIAVNSWRGCYGAAHARTQAEYIKDARHEPVACLGRMMWGVGAFNRHVAATVSLACAHSYRLPPVIESIALDMPTAMWSKERQGLDPQRERNAMGPVNLVTYKTREFMLSSAQDFMAGESGANQQQHIWQATLGPEAGVWVNHPACISESGNRRPNFWMGQATFPRVAQWKDVLTAIHRLREEDWLEFTHAYFPTWAFDEYLLKDDWAFSRKGDGYLALRAARGLSLVTRGKSAYRELRSSGRQNVWLCQMGRAAQDGDFASFRQKVLALPVRFSPLAVDCATLRGERLEFGWQEPLRVNGHEQSLSGFKHFDNPYCTADWPADKLVIRHQGRELTLDFTAA